MFRLEADPEGNFAVFEGDQPVYQLGRFVRNLFFQTVEANPALHLKEIQVYFELDRRARSGFDMKYVVSGSIHMRN